MPLPPSASPPPKLPRHSKLSRPLSAACAKIPSANGTSRQREPSATDDAPDARPPPTKRARKAINCEPCRNSKLKCDRARPCSSCVLRGTASLCYHGPDGQPLPADDSRLDPTAEFARLRYSISLLENHYLHGSRKEVVPPPSNYAESTASTSSNVLNRDEGELGSKDNAPGMHGTQGQSGFYTGPTSAASHLIMDDIRSRTPSEELQDESVYNHGYDRDLLDMLPPLHLIDAILDYYFEYCNWVYRHVNQVAFQSAWQKFKSGTYPDRIVLATVAGVLALAIRYLPPGDELLAGLGTRTPDGYYTGLSTKYYNVMKSALRRYQDEMKVYTIELVELLLIRCHYLSFTKEDTEELWTVRGELVTIGTAMGLHRDPGRNRFSRDAAERRRWAWWYILLHERWQAFLFGRPLSIASHHFNTQLPSYCDPELDETGRLYLPNIALFRLAFILGEIMEDAVSLRPVSYESFQQKDRLLTEWMDSLPNELDLDEFRMARSLSSPVTSIRRLGVQSIIVRAAYHHIRFTLHRPFAGVKDANTMNESLEHAVSAADKLLSLAAQTTPEFLATNTGVKSHPPIHGHLHWRSFHIFSAAMFFTFQLIQHPEQLGAGLFRSYIRRGIGFLEQSRDMPVTEKALTVLLTLAPLYSEEFLALDAEARQKEKAIILSTVKTLAFPYQDPPPVMRNVESPVHSSGSFTSTHIGSGRNNNYEAPPAKAESPAERDGIGFSALTGADQYGAGSSSSLSNMSSYPVSSSTVEPPRGYTPSPPTSSQQVWQNSTSQEIACLPSSSYSSSNANLYMQQQQYQQQQYLFGDSGNSLTNSYVPAADNWGGSAGFGQSEWTRFMDSMQRPVDMTMRRPLGGGTF